MKITLKEKNRFRLWRILHPEVLPCFLYCYELKKDIWDYCMESKGLNCPLNLILNGPDENK